MAVFFCVRGIGLNVCILCVTFFLAYGQGTPETRNCTREAAFHCYDMYRLEFKGAQALADEGKYQAALEEKCRRIKDKLPCHKELALCPNASKFSLQERGYRSLSDIICDTQELKDSYVASSCQDSPKLIDCLVEWSFSHYDDDPPKDENARLCRRIRGTQACYQETFVAETCPVPLESAKPVFTRTHEALADLIGCEEPNGSTTLSSASRGLLFAMLALAVVRWTVS